MIAITGATGQLGRHVIEWLVQAGKQQEIVALVRSPEKAASLGVAVREADYDRPDTLTRALVGVDVLLLISSNEIGQRAAQHRNVIAAAKAQGVRRIVYTSLLHADRSVLNLAEEHRDTEAVLRTSGLSYTILRNGWYTENYTDSLGSALEHGAVVGSAGNGRISSAMRTDYAEAAAKVLTHDGFDNKTLELAGDESWTLSDLAAEVSRQTGRDIPYRDLPEADYAAVLQQAGLPKPVADMIAHWDVQVAHDNALLDDQHGLSKLLGHPSTSLADAVKAALAHR
ncbi:SDR family oxidoreductase [Zymobacter sp. IVIA_5232.4 C2]|uniref:SDR family oxidoreductase n=1 Tax=Zymobacter sp. IVIA_5232.4 C2 TaxID=3394855 RepID=UPI0039C2B15A